VLLVAEKLMSLTFITKKQELFQMGYPNMKISFTVKERTNKMNSDIFTIRDIKNLVQPIAEKYKVKAIYILYF